MSTVKVALLDTDRGTQTDADVEPALAAMFSCAHQWALQEQRRDQFTLTFSSMLAAMTSGTDPLCHWLRSHLALRGVRRELMTKNRKLNPEARPIGLNTTHSFRRALATARELCPNESEMGIGVRHFMAAYAVIPAYHLEDFLRLKIDRRAWCIELAEHLAWKFPQEKDNWFKYARQASPIPSLGFNADSPEGRDLLNLDREVEAFARLIASRNTTTPLSVGIFGAWGSGKSFFMRRLRKRVGSFAKLGREEGPKSRFHDQIAQIEFNAWHYSEGNLAASFVDHILRNLRLTPDETEEQLKKRREAVIQQLDSAKQDLAVRQKALAEAEASRDQASRALAELEGRIDADIATKKGEIENAQKTLQAAQGKLGEGLVNLQNDIEAELKKVPAATVTTLLLRRLDNPELTRATTNVRGLIADAKAAADKRKLILYGVIVLAIGAVATAVIQTNIYVQLIAVVTSVGSLAAAASTWLKKLDSLAEAGEEFEAEQQKIRHAIEQEVTTAHDSVVAGLRAAVATQLTSVEGLKSDLQRLEQAPASARLELEAIEKQRTDALAQQAEAAAAVESKKAELAKLTTGTLLEEFLNDLASNNGYLSQLTIFSRIRNDFEKLSELMMKANEEYVSGTLNEGAAAGAPAVSRIVLYIDDLDRCKTEKVVEVLRLVHLLLAFPLFVCVAAVDPRWLNNCLSSAPGIVKDNSDKNGNDHLNDEVGVPATAADYLEKIFQIPLWLRPVPAEQRSAVVKALLDRSEWVDERRFDLPVTTLRRVVMVHEPDSGEEEAQPPRDKTIDPDAISSDELTYLEHLAPLLDGNPRSLKRFVNTYRLVKTALPDVELSVFLTPQKPASSDVINGESYSPFRICMAQLAVLCTQRQRALGLVRRADQEMVNTSLSGWLDSYARDDGQLAEALKTALEEDLPGVDLFTFKLWLERTRRYSFYL